MYMVKRIGIPDMIVDSKARMILRIEYTSLAGATSNTPSEYAEFHQLGAKKLAAQSSVRVPSARNIGQPRGTDMNSEEKDVT